MICEQPHTINNIRKSVEADGRVETDALRVLPELLEGGFKRLSNWSIANNADKAQEESS